MSEEYPTFKSQKYNGVDLILTREPTTTRPQPPTSPQSSFSIRPRIFNRNRSRSRSPTPINSTIPSPVPPPRPLYSTKQHIKAQTIKGQSHIDYIPVEKKVTDYVDVPKYSVLPRKRTVTDYRDVVRVDVVPREVISTDYYAVEHIRCYVPQVVPEKYLDYVPIERKNFKYEYIPVERQIVHVPDGPHAEEKGRYLGVRESSGQRSYENVRESDIEYWVREYGYVRGESIAVLNQKIRNKIEMEKEMYFKQYQSKITAASSKYEPEHRYYH